MSTAPPGSAPTLSETSARNQGDAASAAWKARNAKRNATVDRSVSRPLVEEQPLGIVVPRVRRWSGEQRIRQAMSR